MDLRQHIIKTIRAWDDRVWEYARRTRILFVVSSGYGFSCQRQIIDALASKDVELRTTFDSPEKCHGFRFSTAEEEELFDRYFIHPLKATYLKWHMLLNTHINGFYPKRGALRIYMHHGPGFGIQGSKIAIAEKHDIFFGLSNFERKIFERKRPGIFSETKAFFPIGFPKDDEILRQARNRNSQLRSLKLPDRPSILVTSHWQKESTLRVFGSRVFRDLADAMPDYNVIQTGHPWLWSPTRKIDPNWQKSLVDECKAIEKKFENAFFFPGIPAEQLVPLADLLVADHSSVMTTFSLLDRPIVFFDNRCLEFAIDEIKDIYLAASHPFQDIKDLVAVCNRALEAPKEKQAGRKIMQEAFHSNIGEAGKAAADILVSIGTCSSTASRKWQRVLALANGYEQAKNFASTVRRTDGK